jgi:hypothetical protein
MTPTSRQLLAVADWLDECMECGKQHEFILHQPGNPHAGGTWASPKDGHAYFRRAYMMTSASTASISAALREAASAELKEQA